MSSLHNRVVTKEDKIRAWVLGKERKSMGLNKDTNSAHVGKERRSVNKKGKSMGKDPNYSGATAAWARRLTS